MKGDCDKAVSDYTHAISLKADFAEAYLARAETWFKKGDHANAIADLSEYLRLRPKSAQAYSQRGWLRLETNLDEALTDFNAALRLDPRHAGALVGRAALWERKNEVEKAIVDLTAAIDVAPSNADAFSRRALLRWRSGEHDQAIGDLTTALQLNPKEPNYLFLRSVSWTAKGDHRRALEDCQAGLAMNPQDLMGYYHLATAHAAAGSKGFELIDYFPSPETLVGAGFASWKLSK